MHAFAVAQQNSPVAGGYCRGCWCRRPVVQVAETPGGAGAALSVRLRINVGGHVGAAAAAADADAAAAVAAAAGVCGELDVRRRLPAARADVLFLDVLLRYSIQ